MELNYNKDLLKSILSSFIRINSECAFMQVDKIVIFQSKYHTPQQVDKQDTIPHYKELATGDFQLPQSNQKLKELFLKIQQNIYKNRGLQE